MPRGDRDWVSVGAAAIALSCTPKTILRYVKAGLLRAKPKPTHYADERPRATRRRVLLVELASIEQLLTELLAGTRTIKRPRKSKCT